MIDFSSIGVKRQCKHVSWLVASYADFSKLWKHFVPLLPSTGTHFKLNNKKSTRIAFVYLNGNLLWVCLCLLTTDRSEINVVLLPLAMQKPTWFVFSSITLTHFASLAMAGCAFILVVVTFSLAGLTQIWIYFRLSNASL